MKTRPHILRNQGPGDPRGFVSLTLVVAIASLLLVLAIFAYRRALVSVAVQSSVQLGVDYQEKEEAILRSIVAITPNRAIRAMRDESLDAQTASQLTWERTFSEALTLANAGRSVSPDLLASISSNRPVVLANSGDATLPPPSLVFQAPGNPDALIAAGINRDFGTGYPVPLLSTNPTDTTRDATWPVISTSKVHGTLSQPGVRLPVADYPDFNLLTYPDIGFGYARPGEPFVAKRNWWAFTMDLGSQGSSSTRLVRPRRSFVLSIYEVPSQLAISSNTFTSLGRHASGENWTGVNIEGGVFASFAEVQGNTNIPFLSARRGTSISATSRVGNLTFDGDPFDPGVREAHYVTEGNFFPVSLSSETGRAAFVPINRGAAFFDRFVHKPENNTISSTPWNRYSVGALQCAMYLDVIDCVSETNQTPTRFRFSYLQGGSRREIEMPATLSSDDELPEGFVQCCVDGQARNFGSQLVDVAYGANGSYMFLREVSGSVTFNEATFGPMPGINGKAGFFRPSTPFGVTLTEAGKICITVYPERFPSFLAAIGADDSSVNHSLTVNVDYTDTGEEDLAIPSMPCSELDYGVILRECSDLTSFTKGFSLVTNLRVYFADDFNTTPTTPPVGYTSGGSYYPPCSVFAPEKRFGVDLDPLAVSIGGQVGSIANEGTSDGFSQSTGNTRPLETKGQSGASLAASRITANLRPITHPGALPPITMMNWLIVLEEIRPLTTSQD
jgi:hypothetical protein